MAAVPCQRNQAVPKALINRYHPICGYTLPKVIKRRRWRYCKTPIPFTPRKSCWGHYLEEENYTAYFDLLDEIPENNLENTELKQLYNLYGTLKMDGRAEYELTPDEEALVRNIVASNTRWVYEAQAILYVAYNEEYPMDLPHINELMDEATLGQFVNHKTMLQASEETNIFPTPANTHLNIQLPDGTDNAVFELFGLNGKLHMRVNLTGSTQVNTFDLPNGIYVHHVISH